MTTSQARARGINAVRGLAIGLALLAIGVLFIAVLWSLDHPHAHALLVMAAVAATPVVCGMAFLPVVDRQAQRGRRR